jgi:putative aldouronate transport system permease protein
MKRLSLQDRIFDGVNYTFLTFILLLVLYPLWFVVIASFSEPDLVNAGKVWLIPRGFNLDGYVRLMDEKRIWSGYLNSFFYLFAGTTINLFLTIPAAYALSRKDFVGRNFFILIVTITMFFSGGLIPLYLVVKGLGILNTRWAMILPQAVIAWNLIVTRTFFQASIPEELLDASRIDGCSNTQFFIRIVLPLSKAIIAVMVLYYGINHWNQYFNALIYLRNEALYPLQLILREILIQAQIQAQMLDDAETAADLIRIAETIKYAVIIVASLPLLILYPFLQKYFVKGVMIGAIKG